MALKGVKAVVFDVFGTVVDWRSGIAREAAIFLRRHGLPDADPLRFADAWRALYQPSMEAVRTGGRGFVRLDVLHRENLAFVLTDFGLDPTSLPEEELEDLNRAWHRLDPWPDAIAGIRRIKGRRIVAPLSNGNIALLTALSKRAGIPWDAILGAEVVHAYKPMPEAYLRTADVLAIRPEELMMVAAHNDDLAAARSCGLRTGFVARPREWGPGQTIDLAPEQDWDVVAGDFRHLADELGAQ